MRLVSVILMVFIFSPFVGRADGPSATSPLIPKKINEVGIVTAQPALLFREGVHVLYFNEANYRQRAWDHQYMNRDELIARMLANAPYLTEQQIRWNGIIMRIMQEPVGARIVFAQGGYGRASISGIKNTELAEEIDTLFTGSSFSDEKGTGITALSESRQITYIAMMMALKGQEVQGIDVATEAFLVHLRTELEEQEREYEEALDKSTKGDPTERAEARYRMQLLRGTIDANQTYLEGMKEIETTGKASIDTLFRFVKILSGLDYTNGLFEAARGMREVFIYELLTEIYAIVNPIWGTSLAAVPIDFLLSLPVRMQSVSYAQEMDASVLGREPSFRGDNYLNKDGSSRYWFPEGLVRSAVKGTEQFDVNGRNIDLEMLILNVPGLEPYFELHPRYNRVIDALAIETTEAALKGDANAVPAAIEKLKAAIDRKALVEWAKKNPPPKSPKTDPFDGARALVNKFERTETGPSAKETKELRDLLFALRRKAHSDQLSALWPLTFKWAPDVAENFLRDSIKEAAAQSKKLGKVKTEEQLAKFKYTNFNYIGNLLSSTIFNWGKKGDENAPIKFKYAMMLAKISPEIFGGTYGLFGAEFYRRLQAHQHAFEHKFYHGHLRYEVACELFERAVIAMLAEHSPDLNEEITLEKALRPLEVHGLTIELAKAVEVFSGEQPRIMIWFIESVEHLLGAEMSDRLIRALFPDFAEDLILHLRMERIGKSISNADMMRCLFEMSSLMVPEDERRDDANIRQMLAKGGFFERFLGTDVPTQRRRPPESLPEN